MAFMTREEFKRIWDAMSKQPEPTEEEALAWLRGAMGKLPRRKGSAK